MAKDRTDYTSSRSEPTELTNIPPQKDYSKGQSIEKLLRDDADGNSDNSGLANKLPNGK